jgi:hypothetical protein
MGRSPNTAPTVSMLLLIAAALSSCGSKDTFDIVASDTQDYNPMLATTPNKLCFSDARLDQHITVLSRKHGVFIDVLGDIDAERVFNFDAETDLESALDTIARPKGWTWFRNDDGSYGIASEEWYRANLLGPCASSTKVFQPEHVRAWELESSIRAMLTPSVGRMSFDDRTNKIVVVDDTGAIERIERFICEVDHPPSP